MKRSYEIPYVSSDMHLLKGFIIYKLTRKLPRICMIQRIDLAYFVKTQRNVGNACSRNRRTLTRIVEWAGNSFNSERNQSFFLEQYACWISRNERRCLVASICKYFRGCIIIYLTKYCCVQVLSERTVLILKCN